MICSLKNVIYLLVGKITILIKRNSVEYIYHVVIPKHLSLRVNDCFSKLCKTRSKPFIIHLASKGVYAETHVGAFSLLEGEVKTFEIVSRLDAAGVFWWKVEKDTNKLDDCNDADCFMYLGEKIEPKQLFRKAGFVILSQDE